MRTILRSGGAVAAMVALSACVVSGGASPPRADGEDGAPPAAYQPMLVVPLPELATDGAPGRTMDALQARNTALGDVLLALFKDSDINLIVDPAVGAVPCTCDIKRATVEEAFEALLDSVDLAYEWDGRFLRVRDRVQATVTVDLIDAGAMAGAGGAGGAGTAGAQGAQGGAGGAAPGAANVTGFWDEIEGSLPTLLGQDATFVVNRTASAIHVDAKPSALRRLREVVATTTGRANRQVSLEARVLEVRLANEYSLGVNWSLLPGFFDTSRTGLAAGGGIVSQTAASGGTAWSFGILQNNDFSVFVDALQQQGQVRVLSSPRVSTLNNQPASITVTDQLPYIVRDVFTTQGVAQTQFSVEFAQAGVLLQVRPLIGEDGLLSVSITPSVREQTGTVVTPDGLVTVPVISERHATTTVRVADGQAIALGGLRSTRKSETRSGVPFLMDLPWVGALFSNQVQERTEVELMIMLVPRVLDDTWINEEVERGAHRLVQLRRAYQWNPIRLDEYRPEDWSGGSLQGDSQAARGPGVRVPERAPAPLLADAGTTVTRRGLADHLIRRAAQALDAGDAAGALRELDRALALEPTRADALVTAGVLCERRGDRRRAQQLLDEALSLRPDDVVALTARGTIELDAGSPYAAYRYFDRAHGLGGTAITAANLGAVTLALGKAEQAAALLHGAIGPDAPPELYANLAFAELEVGRVEHAREQLEAALVAGADVRNPRIVALQRLVAAEEERRDAAVQAAIANAPR